MRGEGDRSWEDRHQEGAKRLCAVTQSHPMVPRTSHSKVHYTQ